MSEGDYGKPLDEEKLIEAMLCLPVIKEPNHGEPVPEDICPVGHAHIARSVFVGDN